MPVLSHLRHLFNAEQCQAYIHTLRWKDWPLQCPRCQSHHIGRSRMRAPRVCAGGGAPASRRPFPRCRWHHACVFPSRYNRCAS
jgi:hypothetical protein